MNQIQLPERHYQEAKRRAAEAGFPSVDDYIAERLESDFSVEDEDFDHFFTPEVVAELEKISAAAKAGGRTYTPEEVRGFKNK